MTCVKCNSQNEKENFCSNCAEPLKEKCFECGDMEWIGRNICETKLQEALEKQEEFIRKGRPKYADRALPKALITFASGILATMALLLGNLIENNPPKGSLIPRLMFGGSYFLALFISLVL